MFREEDSDVDRERHSSNRLVDYIADILLICGIALTPQDLHMEVASSYDDALREIVHLSLEFQRITGEVIISRDLLVLTTRPGTPFDPSPMVDEWANPRKSRHAVDLHPVLCTIQLGVVREEGKAIEGAGRGDRIAPVVLLKPKVVLTSFLEDLRSETSS